MGGCGPHNPCQPQPSDNGNVMHVAIATEAPQPLVGGGCCGGGGRTRSDPVTTEVADRLIEEPPMLSTTENTESGAHELSLIEMMDRLSENVEFNKPPESGCSCKDPNEGVQKGCCVVICLKTLETLQYLLKQKDVLACNGSKRRGSASSGGSVSAVTPSAGSCSSRLKSQKMNTNSNMACCRAT